MLQDFGYYGLKSTFLFIFGGDEYIYQATVDKKRCEFSNLYHFTKRCARTEDASQK